MRNDGAALGHIDFQPRALIDNHRGMAKRDQGDAIGKEEFQEREEDSASPRLQVRSGRSVAARLVTSTLKRPPGCVG